MSNPFQSLKASGQFQVLRPVTGDEILTMAKCLIQQKYRRGRSLTSPNDCREFLMLELAPLEHEVF